MNKSNKFIILCAISASSVANANWWKVVVDYVTPIACRAGSAAKESVRPVVESTKARIKPILASPYTYAAVGAGIGTSGLYYAHLNGGRFVNPVTGETVIKSATVTVPAEKAIQSSDHSEVATEVSAVVGDLLEEVAAEAVEAKTEDTVEEKETYQLPSKLAGSPDVPEGDSYYLFEGDNYWRHYFSGLSKEHKVAEVLVDTAFENVENANLFLIRTLHQFDDEQNNGVYSSTMDICKDVPKTSRAELKKENDATIKTKQLVGVAREHDIACDECTDMMHLLLKTRKDLSGIATYVPVPTIGESKLSNEALLAKRNEITKKYKELRDAKLDKEIKFIGTVTTKVIAQVTDRVVAATKKIFDNRTVPVISSDAGAFKELSGKSTCLDIERAEVSLKHAKANSEKARLEHNGTANIIKLEEALNTYKEMLTNLKDGNIDYASDLLKDLEEDNPFKPALEMRARELGIIG